MAAQVLYHFTPSILPWFRTRNLYPQLVILNLQTINGCPTLECQYIWIILVRNTLPQQITPSLLHHFTPSELIATKLVTHFTSLGSPALSSFYPLWTNHLQLLHHFTTSHGSSTLTSFYPMRTNYPLILTPLYPSPRKLNSYLILPHLNKPPPHSYAAILVGGGGG